MVDNLLHFGIEAGEEHCKTLQGDLQIKTEEESVAVFVVDVMVKEGFTVIGSRIGNCNLGLYLPFFQNVLKDAPLS